MTATKVTIKTKFVDHNVRKALQQLGPKVAQNVMKRSMRKALDPMRKALRQTWLSANYRGYPWHRQEIANATKVDVRRGGGGTSAPILGRVGVMYGKSAGANASGRQKIWHLLEGGFRHFGGKSSAYKNFSSTARAERDNYRAIIKQNRPAALKAPKTERAARMRAVFAAARDAAPTFVVERDIRSRNRASSQSKQIAGSGRSRKVVERLMQKTMQNLRDYILLEAKAALNGK